MRQRWTTRQTLVFARDRGICQLCGQPVNPADFHLDHVRPLRRGGRDVVNNLQLAHPLCNLLKGHRMPSARVRLRHRWRMVRLAWAGEPV